MKVTVPDVTCVLRLLTAALIVLPPSAVTVAVGIPLNTTLLALADEINEAPPNVMVTAMAPAPKAKLFDEVVIDAADVVITFDPVSGPTIDTPYPPDEVMVDDTTESAVADAAPVKYTEPAVALNVDAVAREMITLTAVPPK